MISGLTFLRLWLEGNLVGHSVPPTGASLNEILDMFAEPSYPADFEVGIR